MAENRNGVPEVDAATLAPLVRGLLEGDAALDGPWSIRPLQGGYGGQGLYRFAGDARIGNETRPWSVVLKTTPAPQRGALAYSFGFLAQLPGPLMAPRCLRLTTRPDGRTWLWLKEIIDECPGPWDLGRFALAARHLGHFKGAW